MMRNKLFRCLDCGAGFDPNQPDVSAKSCPQCGSRKLKGFEDKTVEALTKMVELAATSLGVNAADCKVRISNQTEPSSCDQDCEWCEGSTHHWNQIEETWTCKHCGHSVDSNDKGNHPSGCDCPTCFPFDRYAEEHSCEDGHSWSPDIGGRICEVCGIKAKGTAVTQKYYDKRDDYDDGDDECKCDVTGCKECDARRIEDYDCQKIGDICLIAGTEECDWDCPFSE
jgi:DNA-directed RNA polymerase subunit RPC12/RpoP